MIIRKVTYALIIILLFGCTKKQSENIKLSGPVFGTAFNIQYYSDQGINYIEQIDSLFNVVNNSLSTYIPDSDISRVNRNELNRVDDHFISVFNASKKIYQTTNGIFDPTIGNVVNAWNFGAEENKFLTDSTTIDSLMAYVGFKKLSISNSTLIKPKETYLEFNAIAKGYGIDVIAEFLETKGITNYLVDIGGDMRVLGINKERNKSWQVGIDDPNFDGTQSYSKIIALKDEAMATSGTYRKFKIDKNGNRYAHIINTKTGYPTKTNILSSSVIAPDCMTADGYATAFQAMGVDGASLFLKSNPHLKAYLIYLNENNELETKSFNGFPE